MMNADFSALEDLLPFAGLLGIELLEAGTELVRGRLEWSKSLCTTGEIMHGGAIMALADTCGGICAFVNLPEGAQGTATVESKTNFLRGVPSGGITATTTPLHKGRTLIVLETLIHRDDEALAAKVTQTQIYHYGRP